MADPLYLIPLCPRAMRPSLGDPISVRMTEPEPNQPYATEIHFRSGIALACYRVTLDTAGALIRFPPQPITGTVSEVRAAPPTGGGGMKAFHAFTADSLSPENVLIGIKHDRTMTW